MSHIHTLQDLPTLGALSPRGGDDSSGEREGGTINAISRYVFVPVYTIVVCQDGAFPHSVCLYALKLHMTVLPKHVVVLLLYTGHSFRCSRLAVEAPVSKALPINSFLQVLRVNCHKATPVSVVGMNCSLGCHDL